MISFNLKIIYSIFVIEVSILFILVSIPYILDKMRRKVEEGIKNVEVKKEDDQIRLIPKNIKDRTREFGWLTKIFSLIEFLIFCFLFLFLFFKQELIANIKTMGAFIGGWMAIKLLIRHDAWADPYIGKAYYYISLIGTFFNLSAALMGALFIYITFK